MTKTIIRIDGEDYNDDDLFVCDRRMSNSGYHRSGKPNWWARIDGSDFLALGWLRADQELTIDPEMLLAEMGDRQTATLTIGAGCRGSKDGIRVSLKLERPDGIDQPAEMSEVQR